MASGQPAPGFMDLLASTRTAVVLLGVIAAATVLGTVLPNPVAMKHVYGRLWFHVLLGLLGVNLAACMVWRRRVGLARVWSLLTHLGILLVLVGALVTLVSSERGSTVIREGETVDEYVPQGERLQGKATYSAATKALTDSSGRFLTKGVREGATAYYGPGMWRVASVKGEESLVIADGPEVDVPQPSDYVIAPAPKKLGFAVKLKDFRLTYHPPARYLAVARGEAEAVHLRVREGGSVEVPGTGWRLEKIEFIEPEARGIVRVTTQEGVTKDVPAEAGTSVGIGADVTLKVLRYEPSFRMVKTGSGNEISSPTREPVNPAVLVQFVRGTQEGRPTWRFARTPLFGRGSHAHHSQARSEGIDFLYVHPRYPVLRAEARGPGGAAEVILARGGGAAAPWDQGLALDYVQDWRIREYESDVEVLEEGKVVETHVIRVNSPLVHRGTKLSQSGYDEQRHSYTVLGVSRDQGVWFVYSGFLAGVLGVMGRFYLAPLLKRLRADRRGEGE